MVKEESRFLSNTIFGLSLAVIIPSLVGLIFPALIIASIYRLQILANPFELGFWTMPLLIANFILLVFGIIYYKKVLPHVVFRSINFLLSYEVSSRTATIVLVTLFGIYISFSVNELSVYEGGIWGDFERIERAVDEFPYNDIKGSPDVVYVKNFILWISHNILQNIRILPFIGSISLLLLTYFFTVQLTNKRFAGIIALIILMQSSTFLRYDTSATYSYFWVLFYLLSLYFIMNKKWYLTHITFIFSLFSKPLTAVFLPATMFFVYNTNIPNKRKILIILIYAIIFGGIVIAAVLGSKISADLEPFDYGTFWMGFAVLSVELRFDGIVLIFLLPLIVALFLTSRRGISQADSILFIIMVILFSYPLQVALTPLNLLPYRYIPFLVFFAIGVGTIFSKKITQ